ncbi:ROK family protein [Vagococcus sp. DIV0080]|uniref:fructokinase n=1 Tax=Candidatus Vagococcus giribetii TaxID=2230876 RepID=A0ABS3HR53_9ENTE|nr:ROK family protein [Vagococcus sp. DIV0080]MBO0476232.1 ROK family protein [Vagococcus sp. DIV0080]
MKRYGSVEAGGTKFVCAVSDENLTIIERVSFPTTTPEETMEQVIAFFSRYENSLASIGTGSFGPIDINKESPTYGYITSTPKLAWQHYDLLGTMKNHFNIPIAFTTDVNAACYGEYRLGSAKGKSNVVYYTVGTGIGGGAIQKDQFIEGFSHPEMGHMLVKPHSKDNFKGKCPFHNNCLEGMASGPAIEERLGQTGDRLSEEDPFWETEALYLAQCIYQTTLMLSPNVIILGGGVMHQSHLIEKVRDLFEELMNGYVTYPAIEEYIVLPKLGDNAGTLGCLTLAKELTNH